MHSHPKMPHLSESQNFIHHNEYIDLRPGRQDCGGVQSKQGPMGAWACIAASGRYVLCERGHPGPAPVHRGGGCACLTAGPGPGQRVTALAEQALHPHPSGSSCRCCCGRHPLHGGKLRHSAGGRLGLSLELPETCLLILGSIPELRQAW